MLLYGRNIVVYMLIILEREGLLRTQFAMIGLWLGQTGNTDQAGLNSSRAHSSRHLSKALCRDAKYL